MYKDKYDYIIIKINSIEESHIFQKMLFLLNITWGGNKTLYSDHDGYYVISINEEHNCIHNYNDQSLNIICENRNTDKKFYNIRHLKKIKNILLYGGDIPSYKPKKIIRDI